MAAEFLNNIKKDSNSISGKESSSKVGQKSEPKKEGGSLFDSFLAAAKKKTDTKTSDSSEKVKNLKQDTKKTEAKTPVNKMVDKLVDIVVDKANDEVNAKDDIDTTKNSIIKEKDIKAISKNIVDKKVKIDKKLDTIKDTAQSIKQDIESDVKLSLETDLLKASQDKQSEEKPKNIKLKVDTKKKIDKKLDTIKETTKTLKNDIQDVTQTIKQEKVKIDDSDSKLDAKKEIIEKKLDSIKDVTQVIHDSIDVENMEGQEQIALRGSIIPTESILSNNTATIKSTDEHKKTIKHKSDTIASTTSGNSVVEDENIDQKSRMSASMFLSSQQTKQELASLERQNFAEQNILKKQTIESVKQSANMLDLNISDVKVKETKQKGIKPGSSAEKLNEINIANSNKTMLNRIALDNQLETNRLVQENIKETINTKIAIDENIKQTDSTKASETKAQPVINISVPTDFIQNLRTQIVGAQQRVNSFMSDLARSMYQNYKPPITAFRMNLNPANLGNISVVIRANKSDKSLSINMNMSSSTTLDSFMDNKALLQNTLQKQFGDNVSLNFGMQGGDSSQSGNDGFDRENKQNREFSNIVDDIAETVEDDVVDNSLNYM